MTEKITRREGLGRIISALSLPIIGASELVLPNTSYALEPEEIEAILKRNYSRRESQWLENLKRQSSGERLVDETSVIPSRDYDLDSLISVLGGIWDALPDERKRKTARIWDNTRVEPNRRTIWMVYQNPMRYFRDRLSEEQKNGFNKFNAAYSFAIKQYEDPEMAIFASRDGGATKRYFNHFPWVTLRLPSVPDRMLIYRQEYLDSPEPNRINQENIDKFSEIALKELR